MAATELKVEFVQDIEMHQDVQTTRLEVLSKYMSRELAVELVDLLIRPSSTNATTSTYGTDVVGGRVDKNEEREEQSRGSLGVYDCYGLLERGVVEVDKLLEMVKNGRYEWNSAEYDDEKQKQIDEIKFAMCPYEFVDGVDQCKRCKNWQVFKFQLQTRSADEGMTTFAKCATCKHSWVSG